MQHYRQLGLFALLLTVAAAGATDVATLRNGFQIRHERREQIEENTRLFLTAAPDAGYVEVATDEIALLEHEEAVPTPPAKAAMATAKPDLHAAVDAASQRHFVDADLINSVIQAESGFNPLARSPKGAQGLMQLMPGTAAHLGVQDAFEPEANIDGGSRYLRELLLRYDGDLIKALAAYNAGPHRVDQYQGVPPYQETRAYVARIIRDFNRKKLAQKTPQPQASRNGAAAAKPAAKSARSTPKPRPTLPQSASAASREHGS